MTTEPTCPHCGQPDTYDAEHRACRMKAAFPGAYSQEGALVSFDMEKIKEATGWRDPVDTRSGISFQRFDGGIWALLNTQIGNTISAWSWWISEDEWRQIFESIPPRPEP